MESAGNLAQNSFTDFGSVIFALIGRIVHFASGKENAGGSVLAGVLRHVYLKKPLAEAGGWLQQNTHHSLENAIHVARTLSSVFSTSTDILEAQQQLIQNLCPLLLLQADCSACGMPTALLACTLEQLLAQTLQQLCAAAALGQDILDEEANLLTAAFKRVSAGKAFRQCPVHKDMECCQSAQAHLSAAFCLLAGYSYRTQCGLWHNGESVSQPRLSQLDCNHI